MCFFNVFIFLFILRYLYELCLLLCDVDGISALVVPCLTLFPHASLCFAVETLCHAFLSLALHCLVSFSARIYYAALPCLALSCHALLCFVLPCLALPCFALLSLALPCLALR